eukprot:CAMPEP_0117555728 /NCGR_PEP_ID=MMETSP0784-20121206/51426_1 /TAXON_ID=39447 /ORGANISM="" /LENGTH=283 /DNA_ID=CAMNT_0005352947 /DNA_START=48 /DNA_END=899 /DNA_ORIENTATION=+
MLRFRRIAMRCMLVASLLTSPSMLSFVKTIVPGVLGIPGGRWASSPGSSDESWGYYVPQGVAMRRVDTSHVSDNLANLIKCLKPELALPWGFLLQQVEECVLVDVPYFSEELVEDVKNIAPGGIKYVMFTHSDFIGMAEPNEWRRAFPAVTRVAHSADAKSGSMEVLLEGAGPWHIGDLRIDGAPGHTEGSVIISSPALSTSFGGDSMGFWEGKPTGFAGMARFSCRQQAKSLRGFADRAPFFEFWFPGHGLPVHFKSQEDRREQLYRVAEDLERDAPHVSAP